MNKTNLSRNGDRSILLSRILVWVFAAAVAVLDLTGPQFCSWLVQAIPHAAPAAAVLLVCLYACSIPAYLLLYRMLRLLGNLRQGKVFLPENVAHLRCVSCCCFAACGICLAGSFWFPTLLTVTLAAGFVGLIVRIVKNVFQQAIEMKTELDLTV